MRIAFNPSTVAALTTPPNNKDITFDLRGRNIFARGVKFYGTDTNTWRPVVDNLTSNSTTSSLSANQGRVLKALIDGKSDSGHNHDGRYVRYYAVTTLDCNNLAAGLTAARVSATNAAHTNNSVYLYISDIGTPFQIQIPDSNVPYIYKRYYSSGKWSGWFKLNAGYADSAGSVAWANITGKPSSYTPSAHTHAWNSLTHSSTTENQAILTNGKANGWKLYTLNISGWNNAANNAHSHANKSVLDGITSGLVNNWNTAYTFVHTITGTDTDKVINKWDEIVNFLAGITEDNKLNTLLNSKLSVYELADKTNVGTIKNNGIYYSTTETSTGTLTNSPFTNAFALINMTNFNNNEDQLRRCRLAFSRVGDIKVSDDHLDDGTAETWYNVLTSKNSGIDGSTIKLNGTSITVYSSGTADGRYVKKSGDTMTGVLTIDTTNFGTLTIKRNNDADGASIQFRGKSSVYGYIGFNAANRNKQLLRWNDAGSQVYTILDTSSTYTSGGKGVINGTTITQVDNADKLDGYHASDFATAGHNHDGRYLRLDGSDTMTGVLNVKANQCNDSYNGAINMNNSNIYGLNSIYTSDRSDSPAEGIHFWRDTTHVDTLRMMDGKLLFTPNRLLGSSGTELTVLHTGNSSVSGHTITINGTSTTWSWRPIGTGASDAAAGNHTHKVKINGSEKTIAATGVTDLGTYLTSQSLRGYVHAYNNTGTGNAVTSISIEGGTITANKGTTFLTSHQSLANYYTKGQVDAKLGKYLPLAGGTMDAGAQIQRTATGGMWYQGRSIALLRETSANGYHALWSLKTTDGSWDFGEYNSSGWNNIPVLSYVLDSNFDKGSNITTYQIKFPLASGTIALTSNILNPTNYYWANNKITSTSKIDAEVRVKNLGAGCSTTIENTIMATNWVRAMGNTGIYFQDHGGGLYMSDNTWIRTWAGKALQVDNTIRSTDFHTTYYANNVWTITSAARLENSTTLVYGTNTSSQSINTYLRGTNVIMQVKKGTSINYNALQLTSDRIYCNNYCDMKYGAAVSGGNLTVQNNAYLAQKAGAKVGIGTGSPSATLDVGGPSKFQDTATFYDSINANLDISLDGVFYIRSNNKWWTQPIIYCIAYISDGTIMKQSNEFFAGIQQTGPIITLVTGYDISTDFTILVLPMAGVYQVFSVQQKTYSVSFKYEDDGDESPWVHRDFKIIVFKD